MSAVAAGTVVTLPAVGEAGTTAILSRWLKRPGDFISEGEPFLEVATDKVETEIPAPCSGTVVSLLAQEEDSLDEGAELALIDTSGQGEPMPISPAHPAGGSFDKPSAAPATAQEPVIAPAAPIPAAYPAPLTATPATPSVAVPVESTTPRTGERREKLTPIRRVIAERMMESLHSTAQLTSVVEVDVTAVSRIRKSYKAQGRKFSYLPFFLKASMEALQTYPVFNTTSTNGGSELIYREAINMGIAVDSSKGLMVPVIRDAQTKSLERLSAAVEALAGRVRDGRITPGDFEGGTFTVTNTGSRGSLFDTPILNHPQTAILGTGAVVERVVPLPGEDEGVRIGVRSFAYLALTYDHRVVDGADAARFLSHIKSHIEAGAF